MAWLTAGATAVNMSALIVDIQTLGLEDFDLEPTEMATVRSFKDFKLYCIVSSMRNHVTL